MKNILIQSVLISICFISQIEIIAQNVGVNTTIPSAKLHVSGTISVVEPVNANFENGSLFPAQNQGNVDWFVTSTDGYNSISSVKCPFIFNNGDKAILLYEYAKPLDKNVTCEIYYKYIDPSNSASFGIKINGQDYFPPETPNSWKMFSISFVGNGIGDKLEIIVVANQSEADPLVVIDDIKISYEDGHALKLTDGTHGDGYVLESDDLGHASWVDLRTEIDATILNASQELYFGTTNYELEIDDGNSVKIAGLKNFNGNILSLDGYNINASEGMGLHLPKSGIHGSSLHYDQTGSFYLGRDPIVPFTKGAYSTRWGLYNVADTILSTVWGKYNNASGVNTTVWGENNSVKNDLCTAWGKNNLISEFYQGGTVWGVDNSVEGDFSTAWGKDNIAGSNYSTVWGENNLTFSKGTTAWGEDNYVTGNLSTAWGFHNQVSQTHSTAWGKDNIASGLMSTAWGKDNEVNDSYSTSWGTYNLVSGDISTAWGHNNVASGNHSTVWGQDCKASGSNTTALGYNCEAKAINSFSSGGGNESNGSNSHSLGSSLEANTASEIALGMYNDYSNSSNHNTWHADDPILTVGIGAGSSARKNAITILKSGNVGIGTTNPSYNLHLQFNNAAKPISSAWTVSSDSRLKKDIIPFVDGLSLIHQIHPVWFTYNGLAGMPKATGVGTIAQELEKIAPYMVTEWEYKTEDGSKETYKAVDYGAMDFILVNSIKEQQAIIESQMDEIELLKSQMKLQQAQIDNIVRVLEKSE